MTALARNQEWPTFGMAVYTAIHYRFRLATIRIAMDQPHTTVRTVYSAINMDDVRDPMLAHAVGQLEQKMAMEAGLIMTLEASGDIPVR